MPQTIHLSMDIKGFMRNNRYPQQYRGVFLTDDGKKLTPFEAREMLFQALAEGKVVLPCGPCEGFSFQAGCPGHETEEQLRD